jgi:hypothetical protein
LIDYFEKNYPKSTMFIFMISTYLRKKGETEKCIEYLKESIKRCEEINVAPNMYRWELANVNK